MVFVNSHTRGNGEMTKSGRGRGVTNGHFESNVVRENTSDGSNPAPLRAPPNGPKPTVHFAPNVQQTPAVPQPFAAQSTPKMDESIERAAPQEMSSIANGMPAGVDPFRERLWYLQQNGNYGDVILRVADVQILVSKTVVSVESTYFENLFKANPTITHHVVQDINPEVMGAVVEYLNRGHLDNYAKWGSELADAAEKLGVDSLKERCPKPAASQPPSRSVISQQPPTLQSNGQVGTQLPGGQPVVQQAAATSKYNVNKENLINSIIEALQQKDIAYQDVILAFMRSNRAQVEEVRQSAELAQLAQQNPPAYAAVKPILYM